MQPAGRNDEARAMSPKAFKALLGSLLAPAPVTAYPT